MTVTDDIFARPPRSARRATPPTPRTIGASCAVCGLGRAQVLICKECAEQPGHSRLLVADWLAANARQQAEAIDTWLAFAAQHADAYDRLRAAEGRPDYAARCQAHRAADNIYGKLLAAQDARDAALAPLARERERLERALLALEGL